VRRRFGRRRTEFGRMTSSDSTPNALSSPSTTPNQLPARPRTTVWTRRHLRLELGGFCSERYYGSDSAVELRDHWQACARAAAIPERTSVSTNGTSRRGQEGRLCVLRGHASGLRATPDVYTNSPTVASVPLLCLRAQAGWPAPSDAGSSFHTFETFLPDAPTAASAELKTGASRRRRPHDSHAPG
jgi:hypothetical protein